MFTDPTPPAQGGSPVLRVAAAERFIPTDEFVEASLVAMVESGEYTGDLLAIPGVIETLLARFGDKVAAAWERSERAKLDAFRGPLAEAGFTLATDDPRHPILVLHADPDALPAAWARSADEVEAWAQQAGVDLDDLPF